MSASATPGFWAASERTAAMKASTSQRFLPSVWSSSFVATALLGGACVAPEFTKGDQLDSAGGAGGAGGTNSTPLTSSETNGSGGGNTGGGNTGGGNSGGGNTGGGNSGGGNSGGGNTGEAGADGTTT